MKVINSLPKTGISDSQVGYNPRIEAYTTLMSDTNELYAIMEGERLVV